LVEKDGLHILRSHRRKGQKGPDVASYNLACETDFIKRKGSQNIRRVAKRKRSGLVPPTQQLKLSQEKRAGRGQVDSLRFKGVRQRNMVPAVGQVGWMDPGKDMGGRNAGRSLNERLMGRERKGGLREKARKRGSERCGLGGQHRQVHCRPVVQRIKETQKDWWSAVGTYNSGWPNASDLKRRSQRATPTAPSTFPGKKPIIDNPVAEKGRRQGSTKPGDQLVLLQKKRREGRAYPASSQQDFRAPPCPCT